MEFAERVDEAIGFLSAAGATGDNPMDAAELVKLCEVRNPHNKPGRRTIITRMGAQIPRLIRAVRQAGFFVTWVGWITDWLRNDRLKPNNDCQGQWHFCSVSFYNFIDLLLLGDNFMFLLVKSEKYFLLF